MDETQLIQRWQETILSNFRQNKESALTPLLCDTIGLLKVRSPCIISEASQSSWHQIGNWLVHQFVIELSQTPVSSFASDTNVEHRFLWKALECINRLGDAVPAIRSSVLSNKSLAQLLAPVGVQFLRNNLICLSSSSPSPSSSPTTATTSSTEDRLQLPLVRHLNWFVSQCNTTNRVRWPFYFESFHTATVRPSRRRGRRQHCSVARVRSWLNHTIKHKNERNSVSTDSSHDVQHEDSGSDHSDDASTNMIASDNRRTRSFHTSKTRAPDSGARSLSFSRKSSVNTNQLLLLLDWPFWNEANCDSFDLVFDILMQFIKFEFVCRSQVSTQSPSLSAIVFTQFGHLLTEITSLPNNARHWIVCDLLLCTAFGLCSSSIDPSSAVFTLLRQTNLFAGLGRTLSLDQHAKDFEGATKLESSLHLLLQLSNHKVCQRTTIEHLIECFFEELSHSRLSVLFTLPENGHLVTLLAELHVSLACASSLRAHKANCQVRSGRHFRCNMINYLFHHEFHHCTDGVRPCVLDHTYRALFSILIQSIGSDAPTYDRVVHYVGALVPCCRTLARQLKVLCTLCTSDQTNCTNYLRLAFDLCEFTIQIDAQWRECQYCDRFAAMTDKYVELLQHPDETLRTPTIEHLSGILESCDDGAKLLLLQKVIVPLLNDSKCVFDDVYYFALDCLHRSLGLLLPEETTLLNHWPIQCTIHNDNVAHLWIDFVHDLLSAGEHYVQLLVNTYQQYETILLKDGSRIDVLLHLLVKTNQLEHFPVLEHCLRPHVERLFEYFFKHFLSSSSMAPVQSSSSTPSSSYSSNENAKIESLLSHIIAFLLNSKQNSNICNKIQTILSSTENNRRMDVFVRMLIHLAFNALPPIIDRNVANLNTTASELSSSSSNSEESDLAEEFGNGYEPEDDDQSGSDVRRNIVTKKEHSPNNIRLNVALLRLIIWHLGRRTNLPNSIELVERLLTKCTEHASELAQSQLSTFVLTCFRTFLLNGCDSSQSRHCKSLILRLFETLTQSNFGHSQMEVWIGLLKENQRRLREAKQYNTQIALLCDTELFLCCIQNLVNKLSNPRWPMFSLNFPCERSKITSSKWPSSVGKDTKQPEDMVCWKTFATALVLDPPPRLRQFSLSFWIQIHAGNVSLSSHCKVHIVSIAFDALSLELWFDLSHSRYVYRLSRCDSIGRTLSSSEASIECAPDSCKQWQLIVFNATHQHTGQSETVRVEHCANWTIQSKTVITLSLPAGSIFSRKGLEHTNKCALLLGHACLNSLPAQHYYSLGNVHMFDAHLSMYSRLWLHYFGPCFTQVQGHPPDQCLPLCRSHIALTDNTNDLIHSLNELHRRRRQLRLSTWPANVNVCLLYDVRNPHVFWHRNTERQVIHDSVMTFKLNSNTNIIVSSLANSGGISVILFMFCFIFERLSTLSSDSLSVAQLVNERFQRTSQSLVLCLKLLRSLYDAHYTHRIRFERDFDGLQTIVQVLRHHQRANAQQFTTELLENLSLFAFEIRSDQRVIFSVCNTNAFLDSCTIWLQNSPETAVLYFEILTSLVREANPFHTHNLTLLSECKALERLLFIVQSPNSIDSVAVALSNVMFVIRCLIRWNLNQSPSDSSSDESASPLQTELVRSLLDATLSLHPNDFTHIKQSKSVFFFLFPSNYSFTVPEPTQEAINIEFEGSQYTTISGSASTSPPKSPPELPFEHEWEIVSNDSFSPAVNGATEHLANVNNTPVRSLNCDKVLVGLLDLFALFAKLPNNTVNEVLDFLVVLVNTDSPSVRDAVLKSFFTIYNIRTTNNSKVKSPNPSSSTQLLRLYIVANQLNNVQCTENTFEMCAQFLNQSTETMPILVEENIERIVPLLGLIASQTISTNTIVSSVDFFLTLSRSLSARLVIRLVNEFGLLHCLMSFLVNFNNNLHDCQSLNRSFSEIIQQLTRTLLIHSSREAWECLCKILNFLSLVESSIIKTDKSWPILHQVRTDVLRSNLTWLVAGSFSSKSVSVSFSDCPISESPLLSLNEQSFLDAYHSSLDSVVTLHLPELKPKDVLERLKFILRECSEVALLSDFDNNTDSHRRFARELLLHLFELVLRSENPGERSALALLSSISSASSSSSSFSSLPTSFLTSNCDLFKSHLTSLLLYFVCSFQPMEERLFAVNAFNIKSNHFKLTRSLIDRKSDSFAHLFQTFVSDLPGSDQWIQAVRKSLDVSGVRDERFYKKQVLRWLEQRDACKKEVHARTIRDNQRYFVYLNESLQPIVNDMAGRINETTLTLQHSQQMRHLKKQMDSIDATSSRVGASLEKLLAENLHECSLWYMEEYYPQHWALSTFEAKHRVRKKLERCHLNLQSRYFIDGVNVHRSTPLFTDILSKCVSSPTVNTRLLINLPVRLVLFDDHVEGEILIKHKCVIFLAPTKNILIWHKDLQEIVPCRYELRDTAVELYLTSGLTYLFAFESCANRNDFIAELSNNRDELPNLIEKMNLVSITPLWRSGKISNFEYLTLLNKLAGRTMNDLMQYPIFPFVLSDYTSDVLNLNSPQSFRILFRPIAVQKREREKHYIDQYNYIQAEQERISSMCADSFESAIATAPYHYGSHYSNSGIILHYLVRLPPYTQMFLNYQDANFDYADRAFHSMDTTWRLATEDSTSGFKELIPEFFYLPEFLLNQEHFNLGVRQNGEPVDHVCLPAWCRADARLFTLIGRQALESSYVTQHLHEWIDLIFGFRQSGKAAVEAINVFHPATYFEDDLSKIQDELKRRALQTMIRTYGQMPRQLFNMHHPARKLLHEESADSQQIQPTLNGACLVSPMSEVIGLRWGHYVGSPAYGKPIVNFQRSFPNTIGSIWTLPTNDVFVLSTNCSLLVNYNLQRNTFLNTLYIVSYSLCRWSNSHSHVWFTRKDSREQHPLDGLSRFTGKITLCSTTPECEYVFVALDTGLIIALNSEDSGKCCSLIGHRCAVTNIVINKNYSIVVTGDTSGRVIVWDLYKLEYIRTLNCDSLTPARRHNSGSTCSDKKPANNLLDESFTSLNLDELNDSSTQSNSQDSQDSTQTVPIGGNHDRQSGEEDDDDDSEMFGAFDESACVKSIVSSIAISDTLGDIAILTRLDVPSGVCSSLDVFTINGLKVGNVQSKAAEPFMTCVAYSNCVEGQAINVIATGFSNGTVKLWSSWDLQLYRQIRLHQVDFPLKSLCFAQQSELLFLVYSDNQLIVLENPAQSSGNENGANRSQNKRRNFRLVDLTSNN